MSIKTRKVLVNRPRLDLKNMNSKVRFVNLNFNKIMSKIILESYKSYKSLSLLAILSEIIHEIRQISD